MQLMLTLKNKRGKEFLLAGESCFRKILMRPATLEIELIFQRRRSFSFLLFEIDSHFDQRQWAWQY